jgi:DNA-binding CsgD family transcriptional regulator
MNRKPAYTYQWQNPVLRETVYPFREMKLREFLLIYEEIDLWKEMATKPVNPKITQEITQEREDLQIALNKAEQDNQSVDQALKAMAPKQREALKSVQPLVYQKYPLQNKLTVLEDKRKTVLRSILWYRCHARSAPQYDGRKRELAQVRAPYNQTRQELEILLETYNAALGPLEAETKSLKEKSESLTGQIKDLKEKLRQLPSLDKNGSVSKQTAMAWTMAKREAQLSRLNHDGLLKRVLERFDAEPERYPQWFQYMLIHFTGMRYQSAHGSWADPKDLLEAIRIDDLEQKVDGLPPEQLQSEATEVESALQKELKTTTDDYQKRQIQGQILRLNNPYARKAAVLKYRTAQEVERVRQITDPKQVLSRIEAMRDRFPEWAWKEIISRTQLRVTYAQDENWETLTPAERSQRWTVENQRWRQILDYWEGKDITGWREQHSLTLSLIVTRAVCNEIAEHIQHLRGNVPPGGLTAKPQWYLHQAKEVSATGEEEKPYFKKPSQETDLKPGASIFYLMWVSNQPNPWQIAHPLSGVDIFPLAGRSPKNANLGASSGSNWIYRLEGDHYIRTARGVSAKKSAAPMVKEWLRWSHEATVVEVVDMAAGTMVLTFETYPHIGINKIPLCRILSNSPRCGLSQENWDIFAGYVPPGSPDLEKVAAMLDREKILPEAEKDRGPGMVPYGLPAAAPAAGGAPTTTGWLSRPLVVDARSKEITDRWESLTSRERQVVSQVLSDRSTDEMAAGLSIAPSTVRSHISKALKKFSLNHRSELRLVLADFNFTAR